MLRLIGAIVVVLLVFGPLLERLGYLPEGILRTLVDLEVGAFRDMGAWFSNILNGHRA